MYLVRTPVEDSVQILGSVDINLADFGEDEPKQFKELISDSYIGHDAHLCYHVKGTLVAQDPKKPKTLDDQQPMQDEFKRLKTQLTQLQNDQSQVVDAFEDTIFRKKQEIAKMVLKMQEGKRDSGIAIAEAQAEIEKLRQKLEKKMH